MRKGFLVYCKGFSMGAADVVPGVSGATIALIVGIYDRLIAAITAIDPRRLRPALRVHEPDGRAALRAELERMDAAFLLALGLGIVTAVVALSRVMHAAVMTYPVPTYGFFSGLIVASAVVLYGNVDRWTPRRVGIGAAGAAIAWVVTGLTASNAPHGPPMVFLAGAVAICAMVLPGVSGAFFLVALGQYEYLTGALSEFVDGVISLGTGGASAGVVDAGFVVAIFVAGAVVGLFTMAHAVRYALDRYRAATLVFLVSLMVGALRLPYVKVVTNLGDTVAGTPVAAIVAALVGATAVLLVDHLTDDLEYA